ncbi:hypothetical protein PTKIN_Ptkin12aG0091400 [Pterospermum kingtungense]
MVLQWMMQDGTPWHGNNTRDHPGMIQVYLGSEGALDVDGKELPQLLYVSREKRPGYQHHKKAGAMNTLVTDQHFRLRWDSRPCICRHRVCLQQAGAIWLWSTRPREEATKDDMRLLAFIVLLLLWRVKEETKEDGTQKGLTWRSSILQEEENDGKELCEKRKNFEKRFGQSPVFIASTLMENGGLPEGTNTTSLIKEAIHVISCGYEEKTEWGKEVNWRIYGSVTEDILTGFKMHCRGWKSDYCEPKRPALKGSAPINLSDRLHQVLRWALASVAIFLSRHCPLWYGYGGKLKWLGRLAYISTIVYPFTSIPLLAYCTIPAVCLLTGKFIIPTLSNLTSVWFLALFLSIIATGVLELRWSGVSIQDWWRNGQFWVIGGVSAHLFAVFQGLLKVLAGVDTNFTATAKATDDTEFGELYLFKWTTLLIPPTTLIILNMVGMVAGVSDAINNGYGSWGPLFGKLFFAFWVIVQLYPFLKGLMGKQNRTPTIVVLWSILLASIFSLVWVRINPFLPKQTGPVLKQCGVEC